MDYQQEAQSTDLLLERAPTSKGGVTLKLDQGFKAVLRAFRSFLANLFNSSLLAKGHHHWLKCGNEDRWFERVNQFLSDLDIHPTTKRDTAIAILLIFPAFGPSTGKDIAKGDIYKKTTVYNLLQDEGMNIFKLSISSNNNEKLRDDFFEAPIIQQLWEKLAPKMKLSDFFGERPSKNKDTQPKGKKGPNEKIKATYNEISKIMKQRYGLSMSKEWLRYFPIV